MKFINIKNILLNKINIITYLCELLSISKKIWVSYSIPRWVRSNYNWGDDINPILIELISGKKVIPYSTSWINRTHYLCIGSIIQWYSDNNAIIWGSGLLYPSCNIKKPKKVLAVRGPLTRQCLMNNGIDCPEIYGDPALLFPRFYNPIIKKKYKFGIICHFSEIEKLKKKFLLFGNDFLFINIKHYKKWNLFIDNVLSCNVILSSSLHGIIIADAYSIPNLWCKFSDYHAEDNGFKFKDYFLSVKKNIETPYIIDENVNFESLIKEIYDKWTSPNINLDILMDVCPF